MKGFAPCKTSFGIVTTYFTIAKISRSILIIDFFSTYICIKIDCKKDTIIAIQLYCDKELCDTLMDQNHCHMFTFFRLKLYAVLYLLLLKLLFYVLNLNVCPYLLLRNSDLLIY